MIVEHRIVIAADPALVWAVTSDVERWPDWTPTVNGARFVGGDRLAPGSVVMLRQPMQPESEWTVTEFEEGRRFAWQSQRRGIRFSAVHQVDPAAGGASSLLRAEASGGLAWLLWPLLAIALKRALAQENAGLKARCESLASARGSRAARR